nr:hypothetical protein [Micromonospora provocatoris]
MPAGHQRRRHAGERLRPVVGVAAQVAGVVGGAHAIGYDVDDTTLMELDPVHATPVA